MRSLKVIVVRKQRKPLTDAQPTHGSWKQDAHFEGVKLLFDIISVGIVNPTAQSYSREGSLIVELINQKYRVFAIMFLSNAMKERSRRISSMSLEHLHIKKQHYIEAYCGV